MSYLIMSTVSTSNFDVSVMTTWWQNSSSGGGHVRAFFWKLELFSRRCELSFKLKAQFFGPWVRTWFILLWRSLWRIEERRKNKRKNEKIEQPIRNSQRPLFSRTSRVSCVLAVRLLEISAYLAPSPTDSRFHLHVIFSKKEKNMASFSGRRYALAASCLAAAVAVTSAFTSNGEYCIIVSGSIDYYVWIKYMDGKPERISFWKYEHVPGVRPKIWGWDSLFLRASESKHGILVG